MVFVGVFQTHRREYGGPPKPYTIITNTLR